MKKRRAGRSETSQEHEGGISWDLGVSPVTGRLPGLGRVAQGWCPHRLPPLFLSPRVSEHSVFVHDSLHTKVHSRSRLGVVVNGMVREYSSNIPGKAPSHGHGALHLSMAQSTAARLTYPAPPAQLPQSQPTSTQKRVPDVFAAKSFLILLKTTLSSSRRHPAFLT